MASKIPCGIPVSGRGNGEDFAPALGYQMRLIIVLAGAIGLQPLFAQQPAKAHWAVSYSHKDPRSSLILSEIRFADATHGVAVGRLGKPGWPFRYNLAEPVALTTVDGGATWNLVPLKSPARSLFFLGVGNGWMTAEDGLYKSTDGGKSFKRISGRRLGRIHFLDSRYGFAVGTGSRTSFVAPDTFPLEDHPPPWGSPPRVRLSETRVPTEQVLETRDGGVTWKVHPVSKRIGGAFVRSIEFAEKRGAAMGVVRVPRSGVVQPDGRYSTVTVIAETGDGGATWTVSRPTLSGDTRAFRLAPGGGGYALVWPIRTGMMPAIYRIEAGQTGATRVFASGDLVPTDLAVLGDSSLWLATVRYPSYGIPTEVKMLCTSSGNAFTDTAIESPVTANNVVMTAAPGGTMWAATDTGIILKLNQD